MGALILLPIIFQGKSGGNSQRHAEISLRKPEHLQAKCSAPAIMESDGSSESSSSIVSSEYECGNCGEAGGKWIGCDSCDKWFHFQCVGNLCTAGYAEYIIAVFLLAVH